MRKERIGKCELYLGDCMELMRQYPDKHFDLAIVDPPYGSGTIAIACNDMGYDLTAAEIDEEYFNKACSRIREANKQGDLFKETA